VRALRRLALTPLFALASCAPAEDPELARAPGRDPAAASSNAAASGDRAGVRGYALEALLGDPRRRDVARARVLLGIECGHGDGRACVEEALILELYDGRPMALGTAMRAYEEVCRWGKKTPCSSDLPRALGHAGGDAFIARDTCAGSSVEMLACYNLAELLSRGAVTAPDAADATVLRKRAQTASCVAG
jgi:hypothetical protein